jgi:hypothetical protein
MIPSESENHKKEVERKHLMHLLENDRVRLNNTYGQNRYLKIDIDIMRKEIVLVSFIILYFLIVF